MMKTRKGYPVYPLTVAQKFHLYYLPFCPNAAVLNIGTSLTIGTDLDWDVLRESIYKAYERNEGMRIRFAKDKEGNVYKGTIQMTGDNHISFFNRIKVFDKNTGKRILPVHYSDNYITLMPGDKQTVTLEFESKLPASQIQVVLESWTDERRVL